MVKDKKTSNAFASSAAGTTSTSPESLAQALAALKELPAGEPSSLEAADEWIEHTMANLSREDRRKFVAQAFKRLGVRMPSLDC